MVYMVKILSVILLVCLVGCSSVKNLDTSNEYKNAAIHDNILAMPKGINTSSMKNEYPVPGVDGEYYNVSTVPPGSKIQ